MSDQTNLLISFTPGAIDTDSEQIRVIRDEPTVKLITIDAHSKYYGAWTTQDTGEENVETEVTVHLGATEDTLKLAEGVDPMTMTSFTFSFKNPENFGAWHIFTQPGRYSILIGAIWQPGWDEFAE